jgi:hypothetical protein
MGCDIHAVVQRRTSDRWETVTPPPEMLDEFGDLPFEDRDYALFAVFAGVRNRDNITPIAEPRGLPDDIEAQGEQTWPLGVRESRYRVDGKYMGDHSFSWLTAAELAAYDWGSVHRYVDVSDWLPWLLGLADDPSDVRIVFGFDS